MELPVFMIGWEFPPHHSGGLGVACHGMTRGLLETGQRLAFVLPKYLPLGGSYQQLRYMHAPGLEMDMVHVNSYLEPYWNMAADSPRAYPADMVAETFRYGQVVGELAPRYEPVLIHAHDWMSMPAGLEAKRQTGKPLVVHVHSMEKDRSGGGVPHPQIAEIEWRGMSEADRIVAVSDYTKQLIVQEYGISPEKIDVVHNGVDADMATDVEGFLGDRQLVVFVGRLTIQKGPEYFLAVAKKVIAEVKDAVFVFAGQGDMYKHLLMTSAYEGLSGSVVFAGFVQGREKDRLYKRADVFVMPSVSEPFGISALEAALAETPVVVSKTAGVTEVLPNAYPIDFWDINKMAETIVHLLRDDQLRREKGRLLRREAEQMTWVKSAQALRQIYRKLLG